MNKLSLHAVDQLYKTHSEDPVLLLLELKFPNSDQYYLVNNTENITSNGQLYTAFPFTFTLPDDNPDSSPELNISLSNVGLDLVDSFRSNIQDVTGNIKVVFASVPDFVEIEISDLILRQINYDSKFINLILKYDDILNTQIPSQDYSPTEFPGLFSV